MENLHDFAPESRFGCICISTLCYSVSYEPADTLFIDDEWLITVTTIDFLQISFFYTQAGIPIHVQ